MENACERFGFRYPGEFTKSYGNKFSMALERVVMEAAEEVRCKFSGKHLPKCKELATVHNLADGQDYCLRHHLLRAIDHTEE